MNKINQTVLMSGADYFDNTAAINPYMDSADVIDNAEARAEHEAIQQALSSAGVKVVKVDPPSGCQDGIYTANWGLCRGDKVVLSSLPEVRMPETVYAKQIFERLGKQVVTLPVGMRFSGQGDALACGDLLFCGSQYRTDTAVYDVLQQELGYQVIGLQTLPLTDANGQPQINNSSGWPDSFFYDIDLALSVLRDDLIAWCPEAFTVASRAKIRNLDIDKVEVSLDEAKSRFACNLVSTGETVVMSAHATDLRAQIEARGLKTICPRINELIKGGGYIRCTTLTI